MAGRTGAVTLSTGDITDGTTIGRNLFKAADAPAIRTLIGAGTSSLVIGTTNTTAKAGDYVPAWSEITSKPTTFAPTAHTHLWADLTDKPTTFAPTIGSTATTAVAGNDARLADARTPLTHVHPASNISDSSGIGRSILTAADAAAVRTLTGATGPASDNGTPVNVTTWYGTQAQYDAIGTKDANTEYNIYV